MNIRYLGHACFLLTAASGTRLLFDPYEPGGYGGALRYGPFTEAVDAAVVSHDHADHNHTRGLPGEPRVVTGPGLHPGVPGVILRGIAAKHDPAGGAQRGDNVIFCAETEGMTLCHLGDLGHALDEEMLAEIGAVEVLLCPVGGAFTIDARAATQVATAIGPRITIPMHFKTPKVDFPLAPVDDFLQGKANVRREGVSEITVTAAALPAGPEIVVLEPAL